MEECFGWEDPVQNETDKVKAAQYNAIEEFLQFENH